MWKTIQEILKTEPVLVRALLTALVVGVAASVDLELGGIGEEAIVGSLLTWLGLSARAAVTPVSKGGEA